MAEVKVNPEVKEEDQDHIDKMVNKAEGKPTGDAGEEKLYANKYKTEDELAKGVLEALKKNNEGKSMEDIYKDLEKGIHNPDNQGKPEDLKLDTDTKDGENSKPDSTDREDDALQEYFDKYQKDELEESDYEALKEEGFSKSFVDRYMKGMQSEITEYQEQLYQVTDGQEGYNEMAEWAKANLEDSEKQAFDNILESGDLHSTQFAIEALYNRYKNANPNEPNLLKGSKPSSSSSDVFESRQQLMEAIGDPKYAKDPAYRKKVEQKLARSDVF